MGTELLLSTRLQASLDLSDLGTALVLLGSEKEGRIIQNDWMTEEGENGQIRSWYPGTNWRVNKNKLKCYFQMTVKKN